jgi:protein-disulfide isomerase
MKLLAVALATLLPCLAAGPERLKENAYGNSGAPIRIEIFSDFQCPGCKTLHDTDFPQLMRDFVTPGKAYLIYRYFPLAGHPYGMQSAEFVCAASRVGKYQAVADALFARQPVWSTNGKVEETVNSVLTPAEAKKVKALTKDADVQAEIQRDLAEGRGIPVMSTPTLLVTYRQKRYPISGLVNNYPLLKSFLDGLLAK